MHLDGIGNVETLGAPPSPEEIARLQAQAAAQGAAQAAARGAGDAMYKKVLEEGGTTGAAVDAAREAAAKVGADVWARASAGIPQAPAFNLKPWLILGGVGLGVYLLARRPAPAPYYRRGA